ncbi:NAD(P)/FAD-dependent oxidoreductase [Cytobacillus purgationiresistens]|uniref:Thioredoxin reductase n=1 Tax=Cytobacillus purgationiresistens TaxID=863449 RepID=A0ABU0AKM7_9BACI|nr:NAD(P)/FAD-dependent oxidoreductase [Cytobacillus purgationiresistens]MDQ0271827.1 thioredoxin reductase [Cytobacillus purgationiresistens]
MIYDCVIIGGGIAGLQAAIQLGRYKHRVLVIDANDGRSTICNSYHNILGYPDGVSGKELRRIGKLHAKQLNVSFMDKKIVSAEKSQELFVLKTEGGEGFVARRVLLATGVMDRLPSFEEIMPCLGITVYVCPDCDGYEVEGKRTIVMGAGNTGAHMALTISYWASDIIYINDEQKPVDEVLISQLNEKNIQYMSEPIAQVLATGTNFYGVRLKNGAEMKAERGFIAYGGNKVKSELAKQLGVERLENQHINVDARTKMTNVPHVWAAGDVSAHSEQVTIAMGEGSQAAIWIHKSIINTN